MYRLLCMYMYIYVYSIYQKGIISSSYFFHVAHNMKHLLVSNFTLFHLFRNHRLDSLSNLVLQIHI